MNNEQLKKQVEEISRQIDEGKTVKLSLRGNKNSARLLLDRNGAQRISQEKLPAGDATFNINQPIPTETVALDLTAAEISDTQINAKITKASSLATAPHFAPVGNILPTVILTRDDIKGIWILEADCSYTPDRIHPARKITAPKGFETDLSSIPRIFWSISNPPSCHLPLRFFTI